MRFLIVAAACAALVLTACAPEKPVKSAAQSATSPTPTPAVENLIAADPRQMIIPDKEPIPGSFTTSEGSAATGLWNRAWDRDPSDPGAATGVTRITITAVLYPSLEEAAASFRTDTAGGAGMEYVKRTIGLRGFMPAQIQVTAADIGVLNVDEQAAWRAEFSRAPGDVNVQYFVFMRWKNTRALVTGYARYAGGAEPPNVLQETKQIALKQAARLRAFPATPQVARTPTPQPPAATTPPPTPRPN